MVLKVVEILHWVMVAITCLWLMRIVALVFHKENTQLTDLEAGQKNPGRDKDPGQRYNQSLVLNHMNQVVIPIKDDVFIYTIIPINVVYTARKIYLVLV
jgi:hypothetical protein